MSRERHESRRVRVRVEMLENRDVPALLVGPSVSAAVLPTATPPASAYVDFTQTIFVANQQTGVASVDLTRTPALGTVQVEVWTETTDAAGRNYIPVDQIVTFREGETTKSVAVPLVPAGPNPGEVRVGLHLKSLDPNVGYTASRWLPGRAADDMAPAYLSIVDRIDAQAPRITQARVVNRRIVLTFSEPMDPSRVQDLRNYSIEYANPRSGFSFDSLFGFNRNRGSQVSFTRALYDATTNSVTLIPAKPLDPSGTYFISSPNLAGVGAKTVSARQVRKPLAPARAITDLNGNILTSHVASGGTPDGSFRYKVVPRTQYPLIPA